MSTKGIFSNFERDELNKITAKSILEKLMNIRQNINVEFTARRLIWELMQNAKDNASLCNEDGEKVDITIKIEDNQFSFTHNKGYFTNEHIRGLIRKYSSDDKDRDPNQSGKIYKTTGRFGTGFMTTHLLSEKVQIESNYKNDENEFNKFKFWLDRSGKGEKEIIQGINQAFDDAEDSIGKSKKEALTKHDFKTSFTYPLIGNKQNLAEIALKEVEAGIAYTLLNVPEINSVTIDDELIGETIYKVELLETITYQDNEFSIHCLNIDNKNTELCFVSIKEEQLQVIIPISIAKGKYFAVELNSTIPRLHLDFPMIGTEDLNLPFVVNSSLFEPTEPRDGVSLMYDDNEASQTNCDIMLQAVNLYEQFLSFVGENELWDNLYNLARIKQPKKHTWIDPDWFKDNVVIPVQKKLLYTPMVDVVNGNRISILSEDDEIQVYFPYAEKDNVREKVWNLLQKIYPQFTPIKKHINEWSSIIWKDCYKFSIEELSKEIEAKGSVSNLNDFINNNDKTNIDFLNDYYELLNIEKEHIKDIIADKYQVIPNQLNEFKKKSELFIDKDIDEELKEACALISTNPREYLLYKGIITGNEMLYYSKKQSDVITEINNTIKENKIEKPHIVCDYLVSLFPQKNVPEKRVLIFEFSQKVYPDDFTQKRELKYYDDKIWEESDKKSLFFIVSKIAEYETVEKASEELDFDNVSSFIEWLNKLITFLVKEGFENNINRDKHPILPNQNGIFCKKDDLFLDAGDIDKELKDISKELGHDFREELLDSSIFLELSENRTYGIDDVAEKISASMKPILRDVDKRKEYKETLKKFYLWMNENRIKAEEYFSDLFEKRFLFLEDDDISKNIKKATELDQLMEEHGIDNIEDLRIQLSKLRDMNIDNSEIDEIEKTYITKEDLVSLGVSSIEQLKEAFKDPIISSRFYHTSTPTTEMFLYAQDIIERAKQNIIEYLKNHPDYDCTDLEETAPTTLVGIVKNGVSIQIVTRPSDNREVIIYYPSEKDTLDTYNSELWVDNAIDDPHILTLGRILKSTGINRIPINMN
ncbi:ATP-binding protein [Flavobacterium sp.]|uniref:ATP-binding protein n=1 Tax=Flavobacterium sp. TaxID=239 RepID=UPI002635EFA0|nr:ATP-binding protein [Flavobacterium sp.]